MHIKIRPFPAVYYYVICEKHESRVEVSPISDDRSPSSTGRLFPIRCLTGSLASDPNGCQDSWVMTISGPGNVTVTH
jgi:hypothetical protein